MCGGWLSVSEWSRLSRHLHRLGNTCVSTTPHLGCALCNGLLHIAGPEDLADSQHHHGRPFPHPCGARPGGVGMHGRNDLWEVKATGSMCAGWHGGVLECDCFACATATTLLSLPTLSTRKGNLNRTHLCPDAGLHPPLHLCEPNLHIARRQHGLVKWHLQAQTAGTPAHVVNGKAPLLLPRPFAGVVTPPAHTAPSPSLLSSSL